MEYSISCGSFFRITTFLFQFCSFHCREASAMPAFVKDTIVLSPLMSCVCCGLVLQLLSRMWSSCLLHPLTLLGDQSVGIWEKCPMKIKGNQATSPWKAFRVSHFPVKIWTLVSRGKGLWFIWIVLENLVAFQLDLCRKARCRNRGGRGWVGHQGWGTESEAGLPSLSSWYHLTLVNPHDDYPCHSEDDC